MSERDKIHQPERVLVGHCPECQRVLVVLNNLEVWPYVVCTCGWSGDTTAVANRQRLDRGGYVEGDPRVDQRSAQRAPLDGIRGPLTEVVGDYLDAMQAEHGIMRCEWRPLGHSTHVHARIFGPRTGYVGTMILGGGTEWEDFRALHPHWQFREQITDDDLAPGADEPEPDEDDGEHGGGDPIAYLIVIAAVLLVGFLGWLIDGTVLR